MYQSDYNRIDELFNDMIDNRFDISVKRSSLICRRCGNAIDSFYDTELEVADAAIDRRRRPKPRRRKGIPNADCNAMMLNCMEQTRRRSGSVYGEARCQSCADSCRALDNFWPSVIPGTRKRCIF
jgi:hypothetical protein